MGGRQNVVKKLVFLVAASIGLLALPGAAYAEENLVLLKHQGGESVIAETTLMEETIKLTEPSCVFTMPKGKLRGNDKPSLEIRFPSFSEEGCEGGGTRTRFYKTTFSQLEGVTTLKAEAAEAKAKVRVGSCLYGIESMSGVQSVPGLVATEVSGEGTTKEAGCTTHRTFTGELVLKTEAEGKTTTYIEH